MIDSHGSAYVIPASKDRNRREYPSITEWIEAAQAVGFNPKPPSYWMERKRSEGSAEGKFYTDVALGAIWFKHYDLGRKLMIWMQAPEADLRESGYLVSW